jgi:uncharacterized protein
MVHITGKSISAVARPFYTYILKIFSRCNLNCTYCYMYNLADRTFERQPWQMSDKTIAQLLYRMREHLDAHSKNSAHIILHGGEPLMGGAPFLSSLFEKIDAAFDRSVYDIRIGVQSNGILFREAIGDLLLERRASVGISLDGPPEINDRSRVDNAGNGSSARVERALTLLTKPPYRKVFAGFLVVIDIESDPLEVYRYLAGFEPPSIDFLLPYDNHKRRPKGKKRFDNTVYADWLLTIFEAWWAERSTIRIREFDTIVRMALGGRSKVESLGLEPVDIVVIESNGDIELVDSLKGTFEGATHLGFNVFEHSMDEVVRHNMVQFRRLGVDALAQECRSCAIVSQCGGGYLPNRYDDNGFSNPSIYCHDLMKLIGVIQARVKSEVAAAATRRQSGQPA